MIFISTPVNEQDVNNIICNYDLYIFFVHHLIWYFWCICFVLYLIYVIIFIYLKIYISMYYSYYLPLNVWTHLSIQIFQVFSSISIPGSFGCILSTSWIGMPCLFLKAISLFVIYYSWILHDFNYILNYLWKNRILIYLLNFLVFNILFYVVLFYNFYDIKCFNRFERGDPSW
jgi:hypothetical protein